MSAWATRYLLPFVAALAVTIASPAAANAAHYGSRTLSLGSRGADVKLLQRYVSAAGHRATRDGEFGLRTRRALEATERDLELTADGVASRREQRAIRRAVDDPGSGGAALHGRRGASLRHQRPLANRIPLDDRNRPIRRVRRHASQGFLGKGLTISRAFRSGRGRVRTSDLSRVRQGPSPCESPPFAANLRNPPVSFETRNETKDTRCRALCLQARPLRVAAPGALRLLQPREGASAWVFVASSERSVARLGEQHSDPSATLLSRLVPSERL